MRFLALVLFVFAMRASGQSGRVVAAGYTPPAPLPVAPGQVITLFVHTPGTQPPASIIARELPLPAVLGGFSVRLEQTFSSGPVTVPLFSVYPVDNCYGLQPAVCIELTAITIQTPWELIPNRDRAGRPENFAVLVVSRNGIPGEAFPLDPQSDRIHIINTCDATTPRGIELPPDLAGPCKPLVTHADGRLVTPSNPARAGQALTMYAFGLGVSGGAARTGEGARGPVALTDVSIAFQAGANIAPSRPRALGEQPGQSPIPIFAGLTPGQVGLYQISFLVPPLAASVPACTASSIASNLTVTVGRLDSFDGAGICVER